MASSGAPCVHQDAVNRRVQTRSVTDGKVAAALRRQGFDLVQRMTRLVGDLQETFDQVRLCGGERRVRAASARRARRWVISAAERPPTGCMPARLQSSSSTPAASPSADRPEGPPAVHRRPWRLAAPASGAPRPRGRAGWRTRAPAGLRVGSGSFKRERGRRGTSRRRQAASGQVLPPADLEAAVQARAATAASSMRPDRSNEPNTSTPICGNSVSFSNGGSRGGAERLAFVEIAAARDGREAMWARVMGMVKSGRSACSSAPPDTT